MIMMADVGECGPNMAVERQLAQQLGVLRLMQIVKRQRISLARLGAIFEKEAEIEEREAVGNTLPTMIQTLQSYSNLFIIEREMFKQALLVRLTDHASADALVLLSGVLKLQNILKKKVRLNIKQLSTFYNQQSSIEERQAVGRNPTALKQTIQALPPIFSISGDFITIKNKNPPDSSEEVHSITNSDQRRCSDSSEVGSEAGSQMYSDDAPISYASAVTAHTVKDDENSRARRSGLAKVRNHLAEFGISSVSQLFNVLENQGTTIERRAVGENMELFRATLAGLPNIFSVSDQFVGLASQQTARARETGLAKICQFLKTKGCCNVIQISGFMGQQGTREEREALGTNPHSLGTTLIKFPNIFDFNGGRFSLFQHVQQPQLEYPNNITIDEFGGLTTSVSPAFLIKSRTRNESIGIDSGYEGSVTLDQPDREGAGDADIKLQHSSLSGEKSTSDETYAYPSSTAGHLANNDGQPSFIMIDIAKNNDVRFKDIQRECRLSLNEYDKPIIGIALSDDHNWLAISSWTDKVYLVDLGACAAEGSGNHNDSVLDTLKNVLQSDSVLKITYDCRMVAAALYKRYGFSLTNVFDTMRAHQILTCNDPASVDELCSKYGGVTPPNKWCATVEGIASWKVLDSGGSTSDIGLAASARVLVPHLFQEMIIQFTDERLREIMRLCEQDIQFSR